MFKQILELLFAKCPNGVSAVIKQANGGNSAAILSTIIGDTYSSVITTHGTTIEVDRIYSLKVYKDNSVKIVLLSHL